MNLFKGLSDPTLVWGALLRAWPGASRRVLSSQDILAFEDAIGREKAFKELF